MAQYDSPVLGFSVEHPCDWEVAHLVHGPCTSDPNRLCDALNFQTRDAHANSYGVTVFRYWPAVGETVTDTVEYDLRTLAPSALDQITSRCCVTVGGKPAMQWSLQSLPEDDHRDHRLTVVHNGAEYMLIFWWSVPFQPEGTFDIPPLSQAQDAFDAFLRSFTFVPISETPTPPPPVPTTAPTPTQTVPPSP